MTAQIDLDSMTIEDLVDLSERVQKKLNEKIAAEKADLEKRQAALSKLTDRVAGKKAPKAVKQKPDGAGKGASVAGEKSTKEEGAGAAQVSAGNSLTATA